MNIEITKHKNKKGTYYRADCKDLPGMPPVGHGATAEEAVAHLFYLCLFDRTGGLDSKSWSVYIKKDNLVINGKEWKWPKAFLD